MIPTERIDMLEQTWHSIIDLCSGLTDEQWKTATDLPGWNVQDNLSHLIGFERALEGLPATDHRANELGHTRNTLGESNEHEVDARRSLPGAAVLAEWQALVEQRLATLRSADDSYFAQPAETPAGPGTMADFLDLRVLDSWSHEQDIRRALGMPGNLASASAEHTIDRLIRTLPIVIGKRAGTGEGDAVAVEITGPVHRSLTYEVIEGRAKPVPSPTNATVATVRMDSDTFATLALGRRTAEHCADRITVEGDTALAGRIIGGLNMMI
jgi:uncharacterized protein (TIGR03083 family)